jgi:hypothetical protein
MKLLGYLKSVTIISMVALTSTVIAPSKANAYHDTNKWERRANLENGWMVFYSQEISHVEMIKIAAAIAADSTFSGGSATTTYFGNFARESVVKLLSEAKSKASKQTFEVLQSTLTPSKLLSAIRTSFNGKEVGLNLAGLDVRVGRETYNRAECLKVLGRKRCVSTPNTYEPYIRIKK